MAGTITDYIKNNLNILSRDVITQNLLKTGWTQIQIDSAFNEIYTQSVQNGLKRSGFTKFLNNGWLHIFILVGAFIFFSIASYEKWGSLIESLIESPLGGKMSTGSLVYFWSYILSWFVVCATPGVLLVSMLSNSRLKALKFLIFGSLPGIVAFFTTFSSIKSTFSTRFLTPIKLLSTQYADIVQETLVFSLPFYLIVATFILSITMFVLEFFKSEKIKNIVFGIEAICIIVIIAVLLIPPFVFDIRIKLFDRQHITITKNLKGCFTPGRDNFFPEKIGDFVYIVEPDKYDASGNKYVKHDIYKNQDGDTLEIKYPDPGFNISSKIKAEQAIKLISDNKDENTETYELQGFTFIYGTDTDLKKDTKVNIGVLVMFDKELKGPDQPVKLEFETQKSEEELISTNTNLKDLFALWANQIC